MKAVTRRLLRLEARFGWTAAVPSVEEEIFERLAAGEWQSALKLLEPRERDLWLKRQSVDHRCVRPNRVRMDLTQVRETLEKSLGGLPPELRYDIARQLMEADIDLPLPGAADCAMARQHRNRRRAKREPGRGDRAGNGAEYSGASSRGAADSDDLDRKSTRLNSSHLVISYAGF